MEFVHFLNVNKYIYIVAGNTFELVEELFRATKPGLSSFANDPQKVLF